MKIGIFDPYLDDIGGGEKYMMTLAQCLSDENSVEVFWSNPKDLAKVEERFKLDLSKVKVTENIFAPQYPTLKRLKKSKEYDAIVVLSDGSLPLVLSKKLYIHVQQPIPGLRPSLKNFLKKTRVSDFIVNSQFTKSFVDKEFGVKSKVLNPPVDINLKKLSKGNLILTVGRFRVDKEGRDFKKHSVLIKAFKDMVDKGLRDWKLVIATSVNEREKELFEEFKKSAKEYPVEFFVNIDNGELWNLYSRSKIYWHASGFGENLEEHPDLAEHFGISTVEAMGAGAVPVVINGGGQKEIVEEGKNGFLWSSIEELERKTIDLIENKNLWDDVSKEASKSWVRYSKENFCKELKTIIK